ncbi:MAG: GNAT family N-acetyltransferase [Bacillaceae bacterium]
MKQQFQTERLFLRKLTEADSARLLEIWSHPEVTKFMNITPFTDEEQVKGMIQFLNGLADENKGIRYAIIEAQSDTIIGTCGFNSLDFEQASGEIGYELDKAFWGNRYGPEAIICLLTYAFEELHFSKVIAKVEPENINSIRVLQKLQFTLEDTHDEFDELTGTFITLNHYCKLRTK